MLPDVMQPSDELARLETLRRYQILQTPREKSFDEICNLATIICETPIALISFIDEDRQWVKAQVGWDEPELPRSDSFCAHAILGQGPLIVRDALLDDRFAANPLVTGGPRLRFYAGMPLLTPEGQALGTLCVIDRVPRTLVPEQLESLQALAHHAVSQLVQRRDRYALERLKDEFLSMVNYELRTPLTAIHGALDLLSGMSHPGLPAQAERLLTIAMNNANRLVRLVNDVFEVLDLERAQSGWVAMERSPCDAAELMNLAGDVMQAQAREAGVTLAVVPQPGALHVDPDRVIQVMTNLLGNAVRYSPRGGTVWLTAQHRGRELEFQVMDHGPGIPADQVAVIFERFTRESGAKGRAGLGLSICRSIVQQHGGRIWVESAPGGGSTFCFTMPLGEDGSEASHDS